MCYAWRITRKDGVVMGFTEHDENLTFDSTTFEAEAGFTASQVQQSLGLSVDNMEVVSAFNSDYIKETDLIAGVYDDAGVEVFWVNWADTSQRLIIMVGNLGEVTQKGVQFTAELRSLTHRLNQKVGRIYQRTCDAVFGDSRCGINKATYTFTGTVTSVASKSAFGAAGLGQASDYFSRGVVKWLTGNNANATVDVRTHVLAGSTAKFDVWTPATATTGSIDNLASAAQMTIATSGSLNVTGAALLTSSQRGGTTGVLVSASAFAAPRVFQAGDLYELGYRLNATV